MGNPPDRFFLTALRGGAFTRKSQVREPRDALPRHKTNAQGTGSSPNSKAEANRHVFRPTSGLPEFGY
jgi:hypothetical protein